MTTRQGLFVLALAKDSGLILTILPPWFLSVYIRCILTTYVRIYIHRKCVNRYSGEQMTNARTIPQREKLTRDRVIEAALAIMDSEGLEAVTMRHVAKALRVEAMSLYNHVEDKEAIEDGVCELVLSKIEVIDSEDWLSDARNLARSFRHVLREHPNVMTLMMQRKHPLTSVEELRPMDAALRLFRRAGLSDLQVAQAYRTFGGFIFGFVMMEAGQPMLGGLDEATINETVLQMTANFPSEKLPTFAELLPQIVRCDPDADFEFGLELLIAGLAATTGARIPGAQTN
jgi:TetR/AcrR family transcriptional regulator, tetracycline repressor protein